MTWLPFGSNPSTLLYEWSLWIADLGSDPRKFLHAGGNGLFLTIPALVWVYQCLQADSFAVMCSQIQPFFLDCLSKSEWLIRKAISHPDVMQRTKGRLETLYLGVHARHAFTAAGRHLASLQEVGSSLQDTDSEAVQLTATPMQLLTPTAAATPAASVSGVSTASAVVTRRPRRRESTRRRRK